MANHPLPGERGHHLSMPHPRCYWVTPTLLVGAHPACRRHLGAGVVVAELLATGVQLFIDLTTPEDCDDYLDSLMDHAAESSVEAIRVEVRDFGVPTVDQVERVLAKLDEAERCGHMVYLHDHSCGGRSSVFVGCYLASTCSGADAADRVSELRVGAGLTDAPSFDLASQADFVVEWPERSSERPTDG